MTMIPLVPISHLMDGVQNDALGFGHVGLHSGTGSGNMTAAAVEAFQLDAGLPETGVADAATQYAIQAK